MIDHSGPGKLGGEIFFVGAPFKKRCSAIQCSHQREGIEGDARRSLQRAE